MTPMHAHRTLATALLAAAAAAGCSEGGRTPAEPTDLVIPVFSHPESRDGGHFGTHMTGAEETPPRPSRAQGQLNLRLQPDGTALGYKLLVANIEDVTQAHIHLAPPGVPGRGHRGPAGRPGRGRARGGDPCGQRLRQRPHRAVPAGRDPRPDRLSRGSYSLAGAAAAGSGSPPVSGPGEFLRMS